MLTLNEKLNKLEKIIKGYGQMLVALSGGVDSTFLLAFAYRIWRDDRVAALTATGPMFAPDEQEYATSVCERMGIAQKRINAEHVLNMIKRNPPDRCYHCKREIFSLLKERADMVGSVLADGTNMDDISDYRPGFRAITELGTASPLKEAGLTKSEIRQALQMTAEELGEEIFRSGSGEAIWEKPAFACLVSRIPYGEIINRQKLEAIFSAEKYLRDKGFTQVRVRCHEIAGNVSGNTASFMARIEMLPEEMDRLPREETENALRKLGFRFVTMDLGGYEKGKLNGELQGTIKLPDRINVTETASGGSGEVSDDVMAEIERFLKDVRGKKYSFADLTGIVERLRMPGGCPWDREQTHESLKKHLVEEANEALEAIDEGDRQHLCEELGDVLLQIVLHAQIAGEAGEFTIEDVVQTVAEKMVRRHPHVFGNINVSTIDEGLDLWEEIKKLEKED